MDRHLCVQSLLENAGESSESIFSSNTRLEEVVSSSRLCSIQMERLMEKSSRSESVKSFKSRIDTTVETGKRNILPKI